MEDGLGMVSNKLRVQVLHNLDSHTKPYTPGDRLVLVWQGETEPGSHAEICERLQAVHIGPDRPKAHVVRSLAPGDVIGIPNIGYWAFEAGSWHRVRIEGSPVFDCSDATEAVEIYAPRPK